MRAAEYLASVANDHAGLTVPFFSAESARGAAACTSGTRTVCRKARCVLETNIALFPDDVEHTVAAPREILELESRNRARLDPAAVELYLEHPPSCAVDDLPESYMQSLQSAYCTIVSCRTCC
jgi:hypothetical protein